MKNSTFSATVNTSVREVIVFNVVAGSLLKLKSSEDFMWRMFAVTFTTPAPIAATDAIDGNIAWTSYSNSRGTYYWAPGVPTEAMVT